MPWRGALIFAAVVAPWLVFSAWQYGTPVPQSLYAKSQGVYHVWGLENARQILYYASGLLLAGPMDVVATGFSVFLSGAREASALAVGGVVLAAWAVGAIGAIRADPRQSPMLAIVALFFAAYAVIGLRGNLIAEWYLVPLAPLLFLGLFAAIAGVGRGGAGRRRLAVCLAALVIAAQLSGLELFDRSRWSFAPRAARTEREDLYRRAAEFLRPRLEPGDVVAASEIGALGYYCDCRILDTVGLVSPEAVGYYPLPPDSYVVNYAVSPELIRHAAPRYLVTLDVFTRRSLEPEAWFQREYAPVWQADTSVFASRRLAVFERTGRRS